uniref:Uncharacterized protein n=1 Tax=Siphoviridae sp. ctnFo11 TaxID=2826454 RepID=A0A8S5N6A4_9CAUD|nr:MAG TPA: hypothetical protein [Siphoviridae sp. ctnFo11]
MLIYCLQDQHCTQLLPHQWFQELNESQHIRLIVFQN